MGKALGPETTSSGCRTRWLRRTARLAATVVVMAVVTAVIGALSWPGPAAAGPPAPISGTRAGESVPAVSPEPGAAGWILVDADTGAVLAAHNERRAMRPASTVKLLTALVAVQRIRPDEPVPISPFAESMPARRIGVEAGERWTRDALLHSMLIASANDAAVALAEHAGGGTLDGYLALATRTADRLGLEDAPFLPEPSGLDDEYAHRGGSMISARDMAIVARAALAEPELRPIFSMPRYDFEGGDGLDHYVLRHNRLFDRYDGTIGMKTGATRAAGHTFVAAAQRNGRTMIAVLFDTPNLYSEAERLFDHGFATPRGSVTADRLPAVVPDAAVDPAPAATPAVAGPAGGGGSDRTGILVAALVVGAVGLGWTRRPLPATPTASRPDRRRGRSTGRRPGGPGGPAGRQPDLRPGRARSRMVGATSTDRRSDHASSGPGGRRPRPGDPRGARPDPRPGRPAPAGRDVRDLRVGSPHGPGAEGSAGDDLRPRVLR